MQKQRSKAVGSRKWLAAVLVLLQLFGLFGLAGISRAFNGSFAGGTGVSGDPYLIDTASMLNEVRNDLSAHYKLINDIDLDASSPFNQGQSWVPIGSASSPYKGTFDGDGHTIKNLRIVSTADNLGLFGVTDSAMIKNIGLLNVNINSNAANKVGSLVGLAKVGDIFNVFATGSVIGGANTGGLIGSAESKTWAGNLQMFPPIFPYTQPAQLSNSYFNGVVESVDKAGGLIGVGMDSGDGTGVWDGVAPHVSIYNSYAAARVSTPVNNNTSGGLLVSGGNSNYSFYDSDIAGFNNKGQGTAKTSSEMKQTVTYPMFPGTGWDFTTGVWGMEGNKNDGYPYLKVFDRAPTASSVTISGNAKVGQTLTGSYSYQDTENDAEGTSTFKWYSADNASGSSESVINGATSRTYFTGGKEYLGKYIRFEVTPVAATGKATGIAVKSAWYGPIVHPFAGGAGLEADPWLIETAEQLNSIRYYLYPIGHPQYKKGYYKLTADIDLGIAPYNEGTGWVPLGTTMAIPFTGKFDGDGHTISNLKIASSAQRPGFFGVIQEAEIQRLGLKNVDIQSSSNFVGGLVGHAMSSTTISQVYATGSVKAGSGYAGGLIGLVDSSPITITDSYFKGKVESNSVYAGGLVAKADGTKLDMLHSYAAAVVTSNVPATTGGLFGSYANGTGTITESYYDKDVSGLSDTGKGEPKATDAMKQQGTYVNWSFADPGVWRIDPYKNDGYPYLEWQKFNSAPTAAAAAISGAAKLGQTLTGSYTYSDADGDLEGVSLFKWYRSDDAAGTNKSAITGVTAKTYVLQESDFGKFISFEVTPIAQTGVTTGTSVESAKTAAVTEEPLPAPAGLSASAGDGMVALNWSSVTGATYYNIYSGTARGVYNGAPVATVTGSTYHVADLVNGTAYYFAVKAVDSRRISEYSNEASATPQAGAVSPVYPTLTAVSIKSSNPAAALAKTGDTATLTFTASKPLRALPEVTIAGRTASVTSVGSSVYKAALTFNGSESEGIITFSIDFADLNGNAGTRVSATKDGSSVLFDKTAPVGTLSINNGAEGTSSASVSLTITSSDGTGSGGVQMRFSNDKAIWSEWEAATGTKAWTLLPGSGAKTVSMELTDAAGNVTTPAISAAIILRNSSGSGNSSSSGSSQGETITVNVENSGNGGVMSTAIVHRTTGADGRKKDEVSLTPGQADKLVDQLKAAGSSSAKLVIPDSKDEVSEIKVTLPKESTAKLADNKVNLEISTNNVRVIIPDEAMNGWKEDLFFNIVPVKTENERSEIEQRARTEQIVREAAGSAIVNVLGRPMMIETNMQNRPVTLVLPLPETGLSEKQLKELGIFIEHSDGTKELVRGEIVPFDTTGKLGIRFTVSKFSTFTVVQLGSQTSKVHQAYMTGYPDGTFGPEKPITRAEMATVLVRLFGKDKSVKPAAKVFTDATQTHWAKLAIDLAADSGLMDGYPDGSFKPEQTITRAETATIAARLSTATEGAGGDSFSDTSGHWAAAAIVKAKVAGVVNGYEDGTFRPEQTLTRAEAVTMFNKLAGHDSLSVSDAKWSDVPANHWAFKNIQEASVDHTHEPATARSER
ncbi:S-layer homology domain-containing protein [Paenibacillus sp. WQ 127069]|uniref:S-layer homology domain-containing protein n=1 Tax=Paenibacillus baimaensis TaxID=2982185 RepID=A0ABT2U9C6_9BACL|nr:S-layer homology domain-containing protein [Paenibacillus sp. WQ 127069]